MAAYFAAEQVPIQTSEDIEEVLYGRSDSCERLMALLKQRTRALRGVRALRALLCIPCWTFVDIAERQCTRRVPPLCIASC